ncbi:MAG TPA: amino acid ABC transporter permease [Acholeplasmataceae bacterium]|jgi:His/Glu/Gln/Arg/opine family amino acid ABC transporter permease subunit|nr:amino acid ABC transporter permease [Acholeplasmataceae bacterium]
MKLLNDIIEIITTSELRNYLFEGFKNTLTTAFIAALIGLVIGSVVAIIKIFAIDNPKLKPLALICNLYTTVIRGTPITLQLFIMVFAILAIPGLKITAVILTFGINSGAYVSENIRAGILSVDKGQMEAGRSLGLSKVKTMFKIVLPQAIKNVIPAIGNELIALVKETAIVSMVGSTVGTLTFDLNQATSTINKTIANYLAPAILAALLYLTIVYTITLIIKITESRLRVSDKN